MSAHTIVYSQLEQATRTEQVVERLRNAIVAGVLQANEQLPNENELSRLMGVSPMTVRDALNTLRANKLIDTRRGRNGGSFVCPISFSTALELHPLRWISASELADLGEFHSAIIAHSARLAAQRATDSELKKLLNMVETLAKASLPEEQMQADMRCLLTLVTYAQSARLANQELEIQTDWTPLIAALYREQSLKLHTEIAAGYRTLLTPLQARDELNSYLQAQSVINQITDRLLAYKLQLETKGT
ncbi:FadR/GntR family transcriptional regulator [Serratia microhaemolytica]|uniref:FadR/GntR family transcriptional regulator n=1 Tax=Serratia microhaemolytica TaxID=2675110 RepID=UPI000FDF1B31|nr:GntR family transcriptional regulator [Serratia microhaemolytica]